MKHHWALPVVVTPLLVITKLTAFPPGTGIVLRFREPKEGNHNEYSKRGAGCATPVVHQS